MLLVSPELFPCQAFRSLGLSGVGVVLWCLPPFLPAGVFWLLPYRVATGEHLSFSYRPALGWLCLWGWLLVAVLGSPSLLEAVFWVFGWGCRRVWLLFAFGPFGVSLLVLARAFFYIEINKR